LRSSGVPNGCFYLSDYYKHGTPPESLRNDFRGRFVSIALFVAGHVLVAFSDSGAWSVGDGNGRRRSAFRRRTIRLPTSTIGRVIMHDMPFDEDESASAHAPSAIRRVRFAACSCTTRLRESTICRVLMRHSLFNDYDLLRAHALRGFRRGRFAICS
jgi:hypothetical protein